MESCKTCSTYCSCAGRLTRQFILRSKKWRRNSFDILSAWGVRFSRITCFRWCLSSFVVLLQNSGINQLCQNMSRNHRSATHSTHKHAAFYQTTRSENIRYDNFSNCSDTCKLSYMRMFEYFGSILVPCVPAPTSFGTTPLDDVVHRASHHIRHNVQPNTVPAGHSTSQHRPQSDNVPLPPIRKFVNSNDSHTNAAG